MPVLYKRATLSLLVISLIALGYISVLGQRSGATLRARVVDSLGGVIVGATVTLTNSKGEQKVATTNGEGLFVINGLAPGRYNLTVTAPGFAPYQSSDLEVSPARTETLQIELTVEARKEKVDIELAPGTRVGTNPDENVSGMVFRGSDLDIFSDDPDQLAADLAALAGGPDGPNGTQLFVDGFSVARVPPKSSIREIRINSNPFTAEQDGFGFGRVEIFTKPGAETLHGGGFFQFNDESLNARNPYAPTRAPYQARLYGASISGPIVTKKSAYFFDFEQRGIDENAVINATVLDSALNPVPFSETVVAPSKRSTFSARFDYQLATNHTLMGRYNYLRATSDNRGIGGFNLSTRAFERRSDEHVLQFTETAILSPKMLNELRLQFIRSTATDEGDNTEPTINVQEAFVGGGSPFLLNSVKTNRFELSNVLTRTSGSHVMKFGGRVRRVGLSDVSSRNFPGTFVFSSLDQFRQVLLGVPGVFPSQFTLAGGEPLAEVTQWDFGVFALDDWRITPRFMLSAGLRYEKQTNLDDRLNFAPRLSFAWSPFVKGNEQPKTVFRGGIGVFFAPFDEELVLLDRRYNGINQQQFIVRDPTFFPNVPTVDQLQDAAQRQTIRRIVNDAKNPTTLRVALSVERQLPYATSLSVNYIFRGDRSFPRSRNINAPLPGTFDPDDPDSGVRPFGNTSNIFVFETSGISNKHTLLVNVNSRPTRKLTMFGRFVWSKEQADNEDPFSFPANSYDVRADYGNVSFDIRANANIGVNYTGPWGLTFATTVRAVASNKYNITLGRDLNGDAVFTDRPTFATDLSRPSVVITPLGAFDTDPLPGQTIIPPFIGKGPAFILIGQRINKTINFGGGNGNNSNSRRYSLIFSGQVQNILNHNNRGPVIGNLSSPLFGLSNASASTPRRADFQIRFTF